MAFVRGTVSILMVWISYQAVAANPHSAYIGSLRRDGSSQNSGSSSSPMDSLSKLSKSCQNAAAKLMTGGLEKCVNLKGLASILEAEDSIVPSINQWVTKACSATPCDEAELQSAVDSIKTACKTDLKEQSIPAMALYSIILHYDETRGIICTQYEKDGGYCLPSILGNVEKRSHQNVTVPEVMSMMNGQTTRALRAFISVSKEAYCTDCAHAIVTQSVAMNDAIQKHPAGIRFEHNANTTVQQVSDICGASFGDGKLPSSVVVANPHSGSSVYGSKQGLGYGSNAPKKHSSYGSKQDSEDVPKQDSDDGSEPLSGHGYKQGSSNGSKQDPEGGSKSDAKYGGKGKSEESKYT